MGANVHLFPWQGDVANNTLALLLKRRGLHAENEGLSIIVYGSADNTVRQNIKAVLDESVPSGEELAASIRNKIREKWDWLLPEHLLSLDFASSSLDVRAAQAGCVALLACPGSG